MGDCLTTDQTEAARLGRDGAPSEAAPDLTGSGQLVTSLKRSTQATPHRFRDLLALEDFERHARRRLPPMIFQYVAGAVETGTALRRAQAAYADYALLPRM